MQVQFRYEQIADNIRTAIISGAIKPGDKLRSVRSMSSDLGVSQATIFRAYFDLEASGLIESKPKSGYYVCYHPITPDLPSKTPFEKQEKTVKNADLVKEFLSSLNHPDVQLDFGLAVPAPELLPLAKIKKSIQKCYLNDPVAVIGYESVAGNNQLRRQLAQLSLSWDKSFTEDDVIITNGCMEAVALALSALTQPGDIIAVESPAFYGLLQLMDSLNLSVIEIPGDPVAGISIQDLKETLQQKPVKAILLTPNFNNPNGTTIPDQHKKELAEMAPTHQVPIIEDDINGELYFGDQRPKTIKTFDQEGWVIYCSSLSKTLMPGYRIGWCVPGRFHAEILRKKSITNISTSSIVQAITAHFLEFGRYEFHLKKLRNALKNQHLQYKRAIYDCFPNKIASSNPQGGFVLWLELRQSKDALTLYRKALQKGIRIAPGQVFFTHSNYKNYFRISFGAPFTSEIEDAIKTLGQLAKNL